MKYHLTHKTVYDYAEPAPVCHNLVHLAPRATPWQAARDFRLEVQPAPTFSSERADYFGNTVHHFAISEAHRIVC